MEKILDEKIAMTHPEDIRDPHRQASALSDIILGGQDGLVNVLGVILGVAAATSDQYIVLVAGLAATFAEVGFHGSRGLYLHGSRCRLL